MKSLYEAIKQQIGLKPIRFHMPGHKGKDILKLGTIMEMDLTELEGLDNLHSPNGVIEQATRSMSRLFGADYSFLLVNGSSAGIIATLLTVCGENDTVICGRNSHISLYKGLYLSGARPLYITPKIISGYGICGEIKASDLDAILIKNPKPAAVFITSPTYEGITSDIEKIATITHKYGSLLIVDEAHGSHFNFHSHFPQTALEQGADIVIQSHHKTLAALGQGSVLLTKGKLVDIEKLAFNLSVMQTTSPSYIIMAGLDRNRELLENEGKHLFNEYVKNLLSLRLQLKQTKNICLLDNVHLNNLDIGKITIFVKNNGKKLDEYLRNGHNIYSEMSLKDYVLLMTSFADSAEDYDRLAVAVRHFQPQNAVNNLSKHFYDYSIKPVIMYSPKSAVKKTKRIVPLNNAVGNASAGFIVPYPPGIPIVAIGEVFTKDIIDYLNANPCISGVITAKNGERYVNIIE